MLSPSLIAATTFVPHVLGAVAPASSLSRSWDPVCVCLSLVFAILSSFAAMDLTMRIQQSCAPGSRAIWLSGGALALGSGLWAMHFLGVLALRWSPERVAYDEERLFVSLLVSVLFGSVGLYLSTRRKPSLLVTLACSSYIVVGHRSMHMVAEQGDGGPAHAGHWCQIGTALTLAAVFAGLRANIAQRTVTAFLTWRKAAMSVGIGTLLAAGQFSCVLAIQWVPGAVQVAQHSLYLRLWGVLLVPVLACMITTWFIALNKTVESSYRMQRAQYHSSQGRYRKILHAAFDAFIGISAKGTITDWNAQAASTFGWSAEEAIGRSVDEMLSLVEGKKPSPREEWKPTRSFTQFLDDHTRHEVEGRIEVEGRHRSGYTFPAEMALSVVEIGDSLVVAAFVHDVTERKRAEHEAEQARLAAEAASRAKSDFLANMSHEIRTPLNGIIGMNDLVLETELTEEQRQCLHTVRLSADLLRTVITDVLDFSKIEAGQVEIENVRFDLRTCVETTLKTMVFPAEEKGLELLCDIGLEVPEAVVSDPARLRQVLTNLIGNAIKFTHQGEIEVRVRVAEEETADVPRTVLCVTVTDTGIGVPVDKLEMIFEAFRQADTSTTRQYGGTGLGLTISRHLVEALGGRIWVESQAGCGARFHFTVPVEIVEAEVAVPAVMASPGASLAGVKALVIDDNRTNRRILDGLLRQWQMRPATAADGPGGLAQLRAQALAGDPFRVVLTDLHMLDMDGFMFVEELHRHAELAAPTVMMLSSAGHRGHTARCKELGITAYLMKPVRQNELHEAMLQAMASASGCSVVCNGLQRPTRTHEGELITRESVQRSRAAEPPAKTTEGLEVLLAEDNEVNRRLALRVLERRGQQVTVAVNGREALQAIQERKRAGKPFDLVLMDVQMPEMGGLEATERVRAGERTEPGGRRQMIFAMTALVMKGDRERCIAAEMDGYLSKPFKPEELDAVLERAAKAKLQNKPALPVLMRPTRQALPGTSGKCLDGAELLQRINGDRELLTELAAIFAEDGPAKLQDLRAALATENPEALGVAAHSFKGVLANLAAHQAAGFAAELEAMSSPRGFLDLREARRIVDALADELGHVLAALQELVRTGWEQERAS